MAESHKVDQGESLFLLLGDIFQNLHQLVGQQIMGERVLLRLGPGFESALLGFTVSSLLPDIPVGHFPGLQVAPMDKIVSTYSIASTLHELLPCIYTTQGSF